MEKTNESWIVLKQDCSCMPNYCRVESINADKTEARAFLQTCLSEFLSDAGDYALSAYESAVRDFIVGEHTNNGLIIPTELEWKKYNKKDFVLPGYSHIKRWIGDRTSSSYIYYYKTALGEDRFECYSNGGKLELIYQVQRIEMKNQ